ncbi:DUF6889 family protein [Ralstonia mannitolilytica]
MNEALDVKAENTQIAHRLAEQKNGQ